MRPSLSRGGAEGVRTPDLLNAIQARSQLRHSPIGTFKLSASPSTVNQGFRCESWLFYSGELLPLLMDERQPFGVDFFGTGEQITPDARCRC